MPHSFRSTALAALLAGSLSYAVVRETKADLFGSTMGAGTEFEDDGCIRGPVPGICGWTGDCGLAGCGDKCVPQLPESELLISSLFLKTVGVIKCSALANVVLPGAAGSGVMARKLLHTDTQTTKVKKRVLGSVDRVAQVVRTVHPEKPAASGRASIGRRSLLAPLTQQGCPTEAQVDQAGPFLALGAAMLEGMVIANLTAEERRSPEFGVMDMLLKYMKDPELLKSTFAEECESAEVSSGPLMEMYSEMASDHDDGWNDDEAAAPQPAPTSMQVCRPKNRKDQEFAMQMAAIDTTCEDVDTAVEQGTCMGAQSAGNFHSPCSDAFADLLGATSEQKLAVKGNLETIRSQCSAQTTAESCGNLQLSAEQAAIDAVMEDLKEAASVAATESSGESGTAHRGWNLVCSVTAALLLAVVLA